MQVRLNVVHNSTNGLMNSVSVQAVDRALLVDTLPTPEQANGNAWAAMMLGLGSVIGFFMYMHIYLFLVLFSNLYLVAVIWTSKSDSLGSVEVNWKSWLL